MSVVVPLFSEDKLGTENSLYDARKRYGLTLLEAARALGTSPTRLEREEGRRVPTIDAGKAAAKFEIFRAEGQGSAGKNLLFGVLPLRAARDILDMSVDDIASKYGLSPSHWRKLECHAREVSPDMLNRLERDVRQSFESICESA